MANAVPDIEPETVKAERHKAALIAALGPVVAACEAARKDGFFVEYGTPLNQFGQYTIAGVALIKRF